ncbi:MAG: SAM-dependent methyltransferase [Sphingobacteriales bacterium]|nr:SAM-dependent methyltransferase [Sphingobacteriales bacterium]
MIALEKIGKWDIRLTGDYWKRRSELCKAKDFYQDWYKRWCNELGEKPNFHRKQWEYVYVLQALRERGCLQKGKRGLGFAVGTEPLPSVFAKYECDILATDILPEKGIEMGWHNSNQLCLGVDSLYKCNICDEEMFRKRVEYMTVDMNKIPGELRNYDFNWSSCSFEHLGTIEKGLEFLTNQLKTLKPGAWAVHTTEYNISSNDETQDNDPSVFFRQRDIEKIADELRDNGHFVEELDYSSGGLPQDFDVDISPHNQKVHLKLQVGKFVVTSMGLIIRKSLS